MRTRPGITVIITQTNPVVSAVVCFDAGDAGIDY